MDRPWHRRRRFRIPVALVALFFLAGLALRIFLPAERWKELALEQLEARTGLQATAGPASIQFPWPLGLQVEDLRVVDAAEGKPYERMELETESVLVSANLGSLLKRKPQIDEIRLRAPRVEVWMAETPSATDSTAASGPAVGDAAAAQPAPEDLAVVLALFSIEDGAIYAHLPEGAELEVEGIQHRGGGRMSGLDFSAHSQIELGALNFQQAGEAQSVQDLEIALRAEGSASPSAIDALISVERLVAAGLRGEGEIRLAGDPASPRLQAGLDFQGELPALFAWADAQGLVEAELREMLSVEAGDLSGRAEFAGEIPEGAAPEELLAQAKVAANVAGAAIRAYGQSIRAERASLELIDDGWKLDLSGLQGAGAAASGSVLLPLLGVGEMRAEFQGEAKLDELRTAAAEILPRLPSEQTEGVPPVEEWPQVAGAAQFELTVRSPLPAPEDPTAIALHAVLQPQALALTPMGWSEPVHVEQGRVVLQTADASFEGLSVRGPGLEGRVDGSAWGWPDAMEMEIDAKMEKVDADQLQAAMAPAVETAWLRDFLVAPAHASKETEPFVPPVELSAQLKGSVAELHSNGYVVRDLRAAGSLREQKLEVGEIHGSMGSGSVEGTLDVDWTRQPPVFDSRTRMVEVPATALLEPWIPRLGEAVDSKFNGEFALLGPMDEDPDRIKKAISGKIQFAAGAGRLLTEGILGDALQSFLGNHYERFRQLSFSGLDAALSVKEGAVHFDRLLFHGETELRVSGSVGLDGRCDYALDCLLPPAATPQLGDLSPVADLLRDEQGRIGFRVDVSGPAAKPKVAIDWDALATRAADRQKDKLQDRLKDEVDDKLKGLLGGLGKKK